MPGINARASAEFTIGDGKLIERFKSPGRLPVTGGCPGAALRLPCAFVFANKGDMCL